MLDFPFRAGHTKRRRRVDNSRRRSVLLSVHEDG